MDDLIKNPSILDHRQYLVNHVGMNLAHLLAGQVIFQSGQLNSEMY